MFGDLDWPLNASRGLSAIAEVLVHLIGRQWRRYYQEQEKRNNISFEEDSTVHNSIRINTEHTQGVHATACEFAYTYTR